MATISFTSSTYLLIFLFILQGIAMSNHAVANNIMYSGDSLYIGDSIVEGNYVFIMQSDCNLVLYDAGTPVWASHTVRMGYNCRLVLRPDADLAVYDFHNDLVWESQTVRSNGNYVLIMQQDRNVVTYGGAIWSTGTKVSASSDVAITKNTTKLP